MSASPSTTAESPGTVSRRTFRRVLVVMGLMLATLFLTATAASAHTRLVGTSPAGSATVPSAPRTVTLTFDSSVVIADRTIAVIAPGGRRVDLPGTAKRAGRRGVMVELATGLPNGSYGVAWRIASTDGHPTSGTFSFGVRAPAALPPDHRLVEGSATVGVLNGVAHALGYLALMVLIGAVFFAAFIGPAGPITGRQCRLTRLAWTGSLATTLITYPLGAADTFGLRLQQAWSPHLLGADAGLRPGLLTLVRLVLLLLMLPLLRRVLSTGRTTGFGPLLDTAAIGIALLSTVALAGHAASGQNTAASVLLDLTHLVAGSVWLGGLGMLLARDRDEPRSPTLTRWSNTAAAAVATLVATGSYAAWREVGSVSAATSTTYGRWFIVKLAAVVLILGFASRARRVVLGRVAARAHATLRRLVGVEFALGAAVLAVTSIITAAQPARAAFTSAASYPIDLRQVGTGASATVEASLTATVTGITNLSLDVASARGLAAGPASGRLTGPDGSTEVFSLRPSAAGTLTAYDLAIGSPGRWRMQVSWKTSPGAVTGAAVIPVRQA